ncbi:hypothetical protein Lal_00036673 [Lupinus albus]|nr:hypothetical protein Lal_00036673 [Lupinus albus]
MVARCVSGLKGSLMKKMGLQTIWTMAKESSLALKVELMEKSFRNFSSYRRYTPHNKSESTSNEEKNKAIKDANS